MKNELISLILTALFLTAAVSGQTPSSREGVSMDEIAKGTFEVKIQPADDKSGGGGGQIGRLILNKTFVGDMAGSSVGQMLGFQSETERSTGGYVAMEVFTGTLKGKKGSFLLQHIGTMGNDGYEMRIEVVPGSGTGNLKGISGKFKIEIRDGKHYYELDYKMP